MYERIREVREAPEADLERAVNWERRVVSQESILGEGERSAL